MATNVEDLLTLLLGVAKVCMLIPLQSNSACLIFVVDIDECAQNNGGCTGFCVNLIGSFNCIECLNCSSPQNCTIILGSFTCLCPFGFVDDSTVCQGILLTSQ